MITVQEVVDGLIWKGYEEIGGSDVWRVMRHYQTKQCIKIHYNDYDEKDYVIVRESVEGIDDSTDTD